MPVAGGDGGATRGGRGGRKNPPVVIYNPTTGQSTSVTPVSPSAPAAAPTSPLKGGTKPATSAAASAAKKAEDAQAKYIREQKAEAAKAKRLAAQRYITDAENMQGQADALALALGPKGTFHKALMKRLGNIDLITDQQLDVIEKGFDARSGSLDKDAKNNEIAAGDSSTFNDTNRSRERASALAEIANQGAGESDGLRAQLMSLRSWEANQGEVNRGFHDSERSINSARTDLEIDTHTAKANTVTEANADRAQLWNEYYAQSAESFTQLGNVKGQQAEYYGLAAEQMAGAGKGKGKGKGGKGKGKGGEAASQGAAAEAGKGGTVNGRTAAGSAGFMGTGLTAYDGDEVTYEMDPPGVKSGLGKIGRRPTGLRLPRFDGNRQQQAAAASDWAFEKSSRWMGRAWKDPGLPQELLDWQPAEQETTVLPSSLLQNARTTIKQQAPEGATLRKW